MQKILFLGVTGLILLSAAVSFSEENTYVGSQVCSECHEKEYHRYTKSSKKARSFGNIKKMEKKLDSVEYHACFECHTTGYGKKGGFLSEEKTPHLKDVGCESCHGPGALHAESGDPDLITGNVPDEVCVSCHDQSRIETFDHQPLMYGGAH